MQIQLSEETKPQHTESMEAILDSLSVQDRKLIESLPYDATVYSDDNRYFLDKVEDGYILIDWEELDPPEGSPGAVEIPHEVVMAETRELARSLMEKKEGASVSR